MYVSKKYAVQALLEDISKSEDSLHFTVNHLQKWAAKNNVGLLPDSRVDLEYSFKDAATRALYLYKKSNSYENEDLVRDSILRKNVVRNFLEIVSVTLGLDEDVIRIKSASTRFKEFNGEYDPNKAFIDESYMIFESFGIEPNTRIEYLTQRAITRIRKQGSKAIISNSSKRDIEVARALENLGTDVGKQLSAFVEKVSTMNGFIYAFAYSCLAYLYLAGMDVVDAVSKATEIIDKVGVYARLDVLVSTFKSEIVELYGSTVFTEVYYETVKFDVKRFTAVDRNSSELTDLFKEVFVNPRESIRFLSSLIRYQKLVYSSILGKSTAPGYNPIKALMEMT